MDFGVGDAVEHGDFRDDVNLRVNLDARLGASELCPLEYRHAEVDGGGVNGIEPAVKLELLCDTLSLGNGDHVEGEFLKDTVVSEVVGLRQHLPGNRPNAESKEYRLLSMGDSDICKFPKTPTAYQLAEHQDKHVVPMRHRPASSLVVVLGDNAPELPLWQKLGNLREYELSYMHICSGFESDAKVHISVLILVVSLRQHGDKALLT